MRQKHLYAIISVLGALVFCTACASNGASGPDLRLLYNQSAQYHAPDRNPIIVIPGILGSRLMDTQSKRVVWGAFEPASVLPNRPDDARLISLPINAGRELSDLTDTVKADGVLEKVKVKLLGIPFEIRAYIGILATLGAGGYRDNSLGLNGIDYGKEHFTCFQFAYDWRRDNVENAALLQAFIEEKRAYIQEEYYQRYGIKDYDVKFDVVAHSMGGLLLRYYLRYGDAPLQETAGKAPNWAGARHVERAILVATPNSGSMLSFEQLVKGYNTAKPILPFYPAALLATFPSIYQLLPRARHGNYIYDNNPDDVVEDIYDPELWEDYNWGLVSQDAASQAILTSALPDIPTKSGRRAEALRMQVKLLKQAKLFHEALDRPSKPPEGLEIFLVAGDALETAKTVSIDRQTGDIELTEMGQGDGTVLRASALMDEREGQAWHPTLKSPISWEDVLFLSSDHLGLTEDPVFSDNVLYWLLEEPRP